MARIILHIDLDAFYCAVEEQRNPKLVGKPFAVGGKPHQRGVVSSCSYAARQFGVRSAMPMSRAQRICPTLIIIPPHFSAYSQTSKKVMNILNQYTPLVEQISIDEAFLDISDLPVPSLTVARQIQKKINSELGLPSSIGIAANKLVAKIATEVGKTESKKPGPPNAITIVPAGEESKFLEHLPTKTLWGVGPKTALRLEEIGIKTIGEIANTPVRILTHAFGKLGQELANRSRGLDNRPIVTSHELRSISQETTFGKDISNEDQLIKTLMTLSETVARRLRENNLHGKTVKIKIRWPDFTTLTRQITFSRATNQETDITSAVMQLFKKVWRKGNKVRLLGVGVSGLKPPIQQLGLWELNQDNDQELCQVIEGLQTRYGNKIIHRGY